MAQINFARKEVNCKIVYYGPGLSGKTTNLEVVHEKAPPERRGDLTSIATEQDRTLFFDFMPLELGKVAGMTTRFLLYTVPGQVYYNSTRKLVLQGADGVVLVADSQPDKRDENLESLKNLEENLAEYNLTVREPTAGQRRIPLVIQWNKRDLPGVLSVEELEAQCNPVGAPTIEAVAVSGKGVFPTLKLLAKLVLNQINDELTGGTPAAAPPPPPPMTPPPVAQPHPAAQPVAPPHPAAQPVAPPHPAAQPVEPQATPVATAAPPTQPIESAPAEPVPAEPEAAEPEAAEPVPAEPEAAKPVEPTPMIVPPVVVDTPDPDSPSPPMDTQLVERRATKRNKPVGEVQFAGESASGDKTFVILLVGIVALAAAIFGLYYLFGR